MTLWLKERALKVKEWTVFWFHDQSLEGALKRHEMRILVLEEKLKKKKAERLRVLARLEEHR